MKKLSVFLLSFSIILFFACEIGLGASVDTEAPSLEILNPPSDAVIRSDFSIIGKWNDDGAVSSVSVEMIRLDNNTKTAFQGLISTNEGTRTAGSWSIPISPSASGLKDGTYEALVAIKDTGGHITTMARTFTIDNTPPVMILQKPSTTLEDDADRFDTFGQVFSIVGQAADDNSIERVEVSVYSDPDCAEEHFIKTIPLENVPPTIDLNVATFEEGTDNDYSDIYGYNEKGHEAVPRYFKLKAYDGAKQYLADGSVIETGNVQESYYLYREIADIISDYKATGIYKIKSGNTGSLANRRIPLNTAIATLDAKNKDIGKFKLNPNNSPTFVVSARSPLASGHSLDEAAYQLTAGNNYLEVQVDPGLDNNPIDEDSIGLYLRECDSSGNPFDTDEESKIWLFEPKTDTETGRHNHDSDKVQTTVSGDSYKFKTANVISNLNYSGLQVDRMYRVYVAGHDNTSEYDNIVTDSNAIYGFKLITSGSFIELEVSPRQDYVTSNASSAGVTNPTERNSITLNLVYQGGATSFAIWEDDVLLKDSTDTPIIISGAITNPITTKTGDSLTTTVENGVLTTSITKNRSAITNYKTHNQSSIKYKVRSATLDASHPGQVIEGGAVSSEKTVALVIDDTVPSVASALSVVLSDTNTVTHSNTGYYGKQYLNVRGSFTEANPEALYYYVKTPDSTETIPVYLHEITDCVETSKFTSTDTGYSFEFKGIEFDENTSAGGNTLYIQVKDKSGNLSDKKEFTFNIDTSAPNLDARFFKFGTGNATALENTLYIKSGAEVTVYGNYDDYQSGVEELTFKLGDDDVTSAVEVTYSTSEIGTAVSSIPADTDWYAYDSTQLSNKAEIKSWKAVFTPAATGKFAAFGVNKTNKETGEYKVFDIIVDDEAPTVSNVKLIEVKTGVADKEAYSAGGHYYVDNRDKTFKISGIATDNVGIESVDLVVTNRDDSTQTAEGTFGGILGQWYFSGLDLSSFDGADDQTPCSGATASLTIKDKAGNPATENISLDIIFDVTAPAAEHAIDDAQKDLVFRIGEGTGGKYSNGTYGNAFTMVIRGNYPDNAGGSGISKYYYKTFRREIIIDSEIATGNDPVEGSGANADKVYFKTADILKNYVIANKTDVFYPLTSVEDTEVEYNILPAATPADASNTTDRIGGGTLVNGYTLDKGYVKFKKSVPTNYKTTIGGFEEGKNYLVIVAEDNVGNTSLDYASVPDGEGNTTNYYCYSINVDITAPDFAEVNSGDFTSVHLTNGNQSKTVSFKVRDTESGIPDGSSITMKLGGTTISPVITIGDADASGYRVVAAEIPTTALASITGYQTILITATDAANNTTAPQSIGVINKDDTPPELSFLTPEPDAEVNKIITVTGKATDPNEVTKITLKAVCGTGDSAVIKEFEYPAPAADSGKGTITYANGQWSVTIDTTTLDNSFSATGKEVTLSLKAQDAAENETTDADAVTRTLTINQNSDRPIITIGSGVNFTQKNDDEIWVKGSSTIYGSVIDDDGIAAGGFKIFRKAVGAADDTFTDAGASYTGGSWNVRLPSDGSYVLKFEVKDKGIDASGNATGTTFTSANIISTSTDAAILATPIIQDSPETETDTANQLGATKETGNTLVPICLDTNPPVLTITGISTDNSTWYADVNSASVNLGGNYNTLYIKAEATDTSGLFGDTATSGITASFSGSMTKDGVDYTITSEETDCTITRSAVSESEFIITVTNFDTAVNPAAVSPAPTSVPFSGTLTFTVTAKDKAGLETPKNFSRTIDNTAPVIKINAPESTITSTAVVTGSIEGETVNPIIYYTIKTTNTQPAEDDSSWAEESHAALTYNVYFDGSESSTTTHAPLFKNYLWDLGLTTEDAVIAGTYSDFTTLYVWIKAKDNCGNISYKSAPVVVDPQGNRPAVTITYPDNNSRLGGTIRVMGTATDNVEAKYVWLQLDINGSNAWDIEDYNELKEIKKSDNTTLYYTFGQISTNKTLEEAAITPDASNISDVAIMIPVSGGSWYQNINTKGELIPEGASSNNVTIWAYATDNDSGAEILKSKDKKLNIIVDKDSPYFVQNSLKLVQYNADGTSIKAQQAYKEGMSVKGEWWLTGQIQDESSGIKEISVTEGTDGTGEELFKIDDVTPQSLNDNEYIFKLIENHNYEFKIKVGSETGVGGKEFTIRAEENKDTNPLYTTKSFVIKYDNQSPELAPSSNALVYNISSTVKNSLGYYHLGSAAYERHSGDTGVERVAVYFTRTLDGVTYVYDPMYKRTVAASRLETGTALVKDATDNLYWGTATASSITSDTLTLSEAPASYVHAGGLAKVKGVVYRINSISGTSVVLSGEPGDTTGETVYFAVANVVDNTSQESKGTANSAYNSSTGFGYGYCSNYNYDDGDMIMENFHKDDSTSWTWELWVNSKNIPDGDVAIHYVAFDKAGNSAYDHVDDAVVENNKPRLVSVKIGLDVNQDDTISDNATESHYYYPEGMGAKPLSYSEGTDTINISGITVKGLMQVVPEVVGGNGDLFYRWKTKKTTDWQSVNERLMQGCDDYDDANFSDTDDYTSGGVLSTHTGTITHDTDWLISNSTDNEEHFFINYEIADSTEGKTRFANTAAQATNKLSINITNINLLVRDEEAPEVTINPFYWRSLADNSVYSSAETVTSRDQLEGHIELPVDLPSAFTTSGSAENDCDPKVSGKVKLTGKITDNRILTDVYLSLPGMETKLEAAGLTATTINSASFFKVAVYNKNDGWKNAGGTAAFATVGTLADSGFEFNILTDTNQFSVEEGHSVEWSLVWDTSKIQGVAAANVKFQVLAYDDASNAGHTTNHSHSANYKIDVVPYITGIETALSKLKSNNPSVYARTALGHYTIASTENIKIKGFNLTGGTVKIGNTEFTYNQDGISVGSAKSGKLSITVNSIESLNNKNSNDGRGAYSGSTTNPTGDKTIYSNYYNRQPNGDNNNLLTDDVVVDIWEIDSNAAVPFNNSGKIIQPVMKINPVTDQLGFAFSSSSGYFSMPGKTIEARAGGAGNWNGRFVKNFNALRDYSYTFWSGELNEFESIGLAYDNLGHSYGTAAGGNVNAGTSTNVDFFSLYTDRWGKGLGDISNGDDYGHHKASKSGYNAIRLEQTGIKEATNLIDKGRAKKPSLVTTTHGSDTNVYLAYYDSLTGQIRFRAGNTANKQNNEEFYKIGTTMYEYNYFDFKSGSVPSVASAYIYDREGDTNSVAGPFKFKIKNMDQRTFYLFNQITTSDAQVTTNYKGKYIKLDGDSMYYEIIDSYKQDNNNFLHKFAVRPELYVKANLYANAGDTECLTGGPYYFKDKSNFSFELYNNAGTQITGDTIKNKYIKLENDTRYYKISNYTSTTKYYSYECSVSIYASDGAATAAAGPFTLKNFNYDKLTFNLYNGNTQLNTNYKDKYLKIEGDSKYYKISACDTGKKTYTLSTSIWRQNSKTMASIFDNKEDLSSSAGPYEIRYKDNSTANFELYSNDVLITEDFKDKYIKFEKDSMLYQINDFNSTDNYYSLAYTTNATDAFIYSYNEADGTYTVQEGPYQFGYTVNGSSLIDSSAHTFNIYDNTGNLIKKNITGKYLKLATDNSYYLIGGSKTDTGVYTFNITKPTDNTEVYLYGKQGDETTRLGPYVFKNKDASKNQFTLQRNNNGAIEAVTESSYVNKYIIFEGANVYLKISAYDTNNKFYTYSEGTLNNNVLSDGNRVKIYSSFDDTNPEGPYIVQNYIQNTKFQLVDENGNLIRSDLSNKYIKLVPEQSRGNFGTFYDRWGNTSVKGSSAISADNYDYVAVVAGNSGREASNYFSLGVIPGTSASNDTVFLIWYDESDMALYYSYTTDYTTESNLKNNTTASGWSTKTRVFAADSAMANAGEYCQIIADANGGVHIAALDSSNSDLVYAYLPSNKNGKTTSTSDFKSFVVDSNGIVGDSLTIDVAVNSDGKAIPTIGYYSNSTKRPKMAYLAEPEKANLSGAISDYFTGVWECSVVPTTKTLDFSNANLVNLGVFKGTTGYLKTNGIQSEAAVYENYLKSGESYFGSHYGIKYGNGTSNPVVGYVVKMSSSLMHIETAQKK